MKNMTKTGLLVALVTLAACDSGDTNKNNPVAEAESVGTTGTASADAASTHTATGTVESISGDQVTVAHEPIETLQWPAMTMAFPVQDAAVLSGIKPGDRVSFVVAKTGDATTITSISKQ